MTRGILLATTAAVGLLACSAAPGLADGLYASAFGGINTVSPMTFSATSFPYSSYPRTLNFSSGLVAGVTGGTSVGMFRAEGELSYRFNGLNHVTVQGEGTSGASGSVSAFAVMANGWFDIPLGGPVTPYIGGGVGLADIHLKANSGGASLNIDHSALVGAWQLGAGAALRLNPASSLTLDYRYFSTGNFTTPAYPGGPPLTSHYTAQSVMVGFRMGLK